MKVSQSSKLYLERKGINSYVPIWNPNSVVNPEKVARELKRNKYSRVYFEEDPQDTPNCGTTKDYPWSPTSFKKI